MSQRGYIFVAAGMTLVVMDLLLNLAGDFPAVSNYAFAADNPFADNLRWYGGYVLGGLFILIGFTQWVPINVALRDTQHHLESNEKIRNEIAEKMKVESALASLQLRVLDLQEEDRREVAQGAA